MAVLAGPDWLQRVRQHLATRPEHPSLPLLPVLEEIFRHPPLDVPVESLFTRPVHLSDDPLGDRSGLVETLQWIAQTSALEPPA